jgi:hypothetical protein
MRMLIAMALLLAWTARAEQTNSLYSRVFDVTNHEGTVFKDARILKLNADFATVVCTRGVGGGKVYVTNLPPVIRAEMAGLEAVKRTEPWKHPAIGHITTNATTGQRNDYVCGSFYLDDFSAFLSLNRFVELDGLTQFAVHVSLTSKAIHGLIEGHDLELVTENGREVLPATVYVSPTLNEDSSLREFQIYRVTSAQIQRLAAAKRIVARLSGLHRSEEWDITKEALFSKFWGYLQEHPVAGRIAMTDYGASVPIASIGEGDSVIGPASLRVIEANDSWWKIAYKFTVRNPGSTMRTHSFEIQFKDRDGYVVDEETAYKVEIPAGQTKEVAGYALVRPGPAATVMKVEAKRK